MLGHLQLGTYAGRAKHKSRGIMAPLKTLALYVYYVWDLAN